MKASNSCVSTMPNGILRMRECPLLCRWRPWGWGK